MRRREFLGVLGGAAAWSAPAPAQQAPLPVIGFLSSGSAQAFSPLVVGFREGLNDTGYFEGRNVTIEYRYANGEYDRLLPLAADLVQRQVAVIVAGGGAISALVAKKAAPTTPIVFAIGDDPIQFGVVASLNRPGGNVTGIALFISELAAKRLELLSEMSPSTSSVALLVNPKNPNAEAETKQAQTAAAAVGRELRILNASTDEEIDATLLSLINDKTVALLLGTDTFFFSRRDKIVVLTNHDLIPTIYFAREFAYAGGLMSYGANFAREWRQVGIYTGRILKGEKPANLPVLQPASFQFIINLKTANALGIGIPAKLLALADEVIE